MHENDSQESEREEHQAEKDPHDGYWRFANKPADGPKLWPFEDALSALQKEFKLCGVQFDGDDPSSNHPLAELYTDVKATLYDFYMPKDPITQERSARDLTKTRAEAGFIRQVKNSAKEAAITYISGRHGTSRVSQKHWRSFVPSHHLVLAVRFTDPFGALNSTIAGCLGTINMLHLGQIVQPSSNTSGMATGSSNESIGIAITAANTAATALTKVESTDKALNSMIQKLKAKIDERDAKIDELEARINKSDERDTKIHERDTEIDELKARIYKSNILVDSLQGRIEAHNRLFRKCKEKLDLATNTNITIESNVSTAVDRIARLEAGSRMLGPTKDEVNKLFATTHSNLSMVVDRVTKLERGSKAPVLSKDEVDKLFKDMTPKIQSLVMSSPAMPLTFGNLTRQPPKSAVNSLARAVPEKALIDRQATKRPASTEQPTEQPTEQLAAIHKKAKLGPELEDDIDTLFD